MIKYISLILSLYIIYNSKNNILNLILIIINILFFIKIKEKFIYCNRYNSTSLCCDVNNNFIENRDCVIDINTGIAKLKPSR